MKTTALALLKLLLDIVSGAVDLVAPGVLDNATSVKHRLTAAVLAIILIALLVLFAQGCMFTTDLDGKVYTWRVDVLTPIGQTVNNAPQAPGPATRPAE